MAFLPKKLRPIRIEGDIAYVPLTKGYEAIIDAADVHLVAPFNWIARVELRADGSIRAVYGYRHLPRVNGRQGSIQLHRALLSAPADLEVDHRDGDGLNNRRSNLRAATSAQNNCNRRLGAKNTSGFKGVCLEVRRGRWKAQIEIDGKTHNLGRFDTPEAAHAAYAAASAKLHGEFGRVA